MASTAPPSPEHGAGTVVRILGVIAIVVLALLLLAAVTLLGLNTAPGRDFVARQIEGIAPESGLRVAVGRLEGSLYGRLRIRDLRLSDPQGVFATAPLVVLDWNPGALVGRRVDVDELSAEVVRVLRLPQLNETPDTNEPLLPNINVDLDRLSVERIILEPPVAGRRHIVSLTGQADVADGRAIILADAAATAGDRLNIRLDAVPDGDRFDLDATLAAPVGGVVDGLAGLGRPLTLRIAGDGGWTRWAGTAVAVGSPGTELEFAL